MARAKTSAWKMCWGRARASSQLPRRKAPPRMFRRSRPTRYERVVSLGSLADKDPSISFRGTVGCGAAAKGTVGALLQPYRREPRRFRALAPEGFRPARVVRRGSKFVRAVVGLWSFAVVSTFVANGERRTTKDALFL